MFEFLSQESIQNWPLTAVITINIMAPLIVVTAFYRFRVNLSSTIAINSTVTSQIRDVSPGYRELIGTAEGYGKDTLEAPLSKLPCVWYEYSVRELVKGAEKNRWVERKSGSSNCEFLINDQTGNCLINPKRAEVKVSQFDSWDGDTLTPAGITETSTFKTKKFSYIEKRIHAGDPLYVIGHLGSATEKQKKLHISTPNKHETTNNLVSNIIQENKNSELPFIISNTSEEKLAGSYKWGAITALLSTVTFVTFFIWFSYARFW